MLIHYIPFRSLLCPSSFLVFLLFLQSFLLAMLFVGRVCLVLSVIVSCCCYFISQLMIGAKHYMKILGPKSV